MMQRMMAYLAHPALVFVLTVAASVTIVAIIFTDGFSDARSETPEPQAGVEAGADLGAEIRAYLLDNPEVIEEALAVLEARERAAEAEADRARIAANAQALYDDGRSWSGGNPDGDVTLVEFFDYRCGYCRQAQGEVAALLAEDGDIRLILKEYPILGPESLLAARFAIAARRVAGPDAYKRVHDALLTRRGGVTEAALRGLAERSDLDADAILAEMDHPAILEELRANHRLAEALQISGTPSFVLGDTLLRGYLPLQGMQQIVADERGDAG